MQFKHLWEWSYGLRVDMAIDRFGYAYAYFGNSNWNWPVISDGIVNNNVYNMNIFHLSNGWMLRFTNKHYGEISIVVHNSHQPSKCKLTITSRQRIGNHYLGRKWRKKPKEMRPNAQYTFDISAYLMIHIWWIFFFFSSLFSGQDFIRPKKKLEHCLIIFS